MKYIKILFLLALIALISITAYWLLIGNKISKPIDNTSNNLEMKWLKNKFDYGFTNPIIFNSSSIKETDLKLLLKILPDIKLDTVYFDSVINRIAYFNYYLNNSDYGLAKAIYDSVPNTFPSVYFMKYCYFYNLMDLAIISSFNPSFYVAFSYNLGLYNNNIDGIIFNSLDKSFYRISSDSIQKAN